MDNHLDSEENVRGGGKLAHWFHFQTASRGRKRELISFGLSVEKASQVGKIEDKEGH